MKNYCVICHAQSEMKTGNGIFNRAIVAVCNEMKKPVCADHAKYCIEEGHGHSPLPTEDEPPVVPAPPATAAAMDRVLQNFATRFPFPR